MHNVVRFPKLTARASMGARPKSARPDDWIAEPPRECPESDWLDFRPLLRAVALLICVIGIPFGFFLGQAIVLAGFKAVGWA